MAEIDDQIVKVKSAIAEKYPAFRPEQNASDALVGATAAGNERVVVLLTGPKGKEIQRLLDLKGDLVRPIHESWGGVRSGVSNDIALVQKAIAALRPTSRNDVPRDDQFTQKEVERLTQLKIDYRPHTLGQQQQEVAEVNRRALKRVEAAMGNLEPRLAISLGSADELQSMRTALVNLGRLREQLLSIPSVSRVG